MKNTLCFQGVSLPCFGLLCLLLITLSTGSANSATIHYIDFGGTQGFTYSPDALTVEVGDTIIWRGNFSLLPLVSTAVPPGAKSFGPINTGTTYSYQVDVAGSYSFQDPIYAAIGMKGNFSAVYLPHGSLTNEGRDFYLGVITPSFNYIGSNGYKAFALITTYYDNTITLSYFDASGNTVNAVTKQIPRRNSLAIELDLSALRVDTNTETAQYKTCHITSKYPISVQFQSTGANSGGSYLALPVIAVGKTYVVASSNDNPGNGVLTGYPGLPTHGELASGAFMIIATEDATDVTIIPTTATTGGHTGVVTGAGANGLAHPFSIGLNKGQCYLVRSTGKDASLDISGSTVQSSKPISVIAGHEDADLGDFIPSFSSFTDGRDYMIEQMLPVEYWDTVGYMGLPFREAFPPSEDGGHGDTYRVFTYDANGAAVQADVDGIPGGYPMPTSRYHYSEHFDINDPTDIFSTNGKKIGVTVYDERSQPAHGIDPSPSMMTIIPKSRWRNSYNFSLLQAKTIDGITEDQYVNIIADSLADIRVSNDGGPMLPAATVFNQVATFQNVSKHYHVTGATYRMGPGSYFLHSNLPFVAYTYGMNKILALSFFTYNFENAAPGGTQLNTGVVPSYKISVDTLAKCSGWTICVHDTGSLDPGIKAIMLVDDTDGIYFNRPGMKYSNVSFDSTVSGFTAGEIHPEYHSSSSYCFKIKFNDPLAAAIAPICIVDNSGNGTIVRLTREAPTVSLATSPDVSPNPNTITFPQQSIGNQVCTTFVIKNTASTGGAPIVLNSANLVKNDTAFAIQSVTPALPLALAAQQSVSIQVCYTAKDSMRHRDSLIIHTDCFSLPVALDAQGLTGLISAADLNFGIVTVGDTSCRTIQVKNVGNASFNLTKSFVLSDNANFTIDTTLLPVLLKAGTAVNIGICFHPQTAGTITAGIDWSTDLDASFAHSTKNHSNISGTANPKQQTAVSSQTTTAFSVRPNPANGSTVMVTIASDGTGQNIWENGTLGMYDVLGREVYHEDISGDVYHIEIPIRNLPEGVYYIKLNSRSASATERFVKTK